MTCCYILKKNCFKAFIFIIFIIPEHTEKRTKLNESVSLWRACESLFSAITTDHNASKHELKPLKELVNDVQKAGGKL